MPGRILIVDDIPTNRILLRVRLAAAFYDVVQAATASEALKMVAEQQPDLVLLSARLGDGDSLALCRAITGKSPAQTMHCASHGPPSHDSASLDPSGSALSGPDPSGLDPGCLPDDTAMRPPVLILTGQADQHLRLAALQAGAEDVLTFPLEDLLLQARLRSLMRVGDAAQESHLRVGTSRTLGLTEAGTDIESAPRICILSDTPGIKPPWLRQIERQGAGRISQHDIHNFLREVTPGDTPDLCLIMMNRPLASPGLRLLSELRAHPETRHAAALVILPEHDPHIAADALDLGAGDVMAGDIDAAELMLRMTLQIRRKRLADQLRSTLRDGLRAAVTDPLTGLYNRRYALPHLARMAEQADRSGRRFAVMLADLDHFKAINDRYGHAAGDAVLVEVAHRLRSNLRAVDMVARIGGEEFLIALPDTDRNEARVAARRLCRVIAQDPFVLPGEGFSAPVTISIGVTMGQHPPVAGIAGDPDIAPAPDPVQHLLLQADKALYGAKACGRNQVTLSKAALPPAPAARAR